MIAFTT